MDVATWLRSLGLEQYEPAFRDNAVDADVLPKLTADDLKELGVGAVGHRRKLLEAIAALRADAPDRPDTSGPEPTASPAARPLIAEAERRQLTVVFADLVGSTELAGRLDPEDLREVLAAYHAGCAEVITRFDGHVAKFLGDGVLAYFGYPRAHEDDAERAVRAGLDLVEAVAGLRPQADVELRVRVGIATGVVVVGELIGSGQAQEQGVVGETPNLAARLQALAAPNSVVVAPGTRRLVVGLFEFADLGGQPLKGFATPVRVWRVLGPARVTSRFEARQAAGLTPLIGREEELALLLDPWQRAKDSDGQVVLLSGEPGIGKSRLTQSLRERLSGEPHVCLCYYSSPYHTNSALHPVIDQLDRAAGFARDDPPAQKLDKLEALLRRAIDNTAEVAPLFAALLSIPAEGRYPALDVTPQRQKELTLEALVELLEGLARREPVLAVFEDAHWIDPTSLELLTRLISRIQSLPALLVVTFRPEFQAPWTGHAHVTSLTLNRLGHQRGAALVERITGKALPRDVLDHIVAKTDGVPLFIEELTKAVLEMGLLREEETRYVLTGPLPPLAIPVTLQDSLMARLDRIAPVREVAQIGAVIGREFSHELLLAAAAPMDEAKLQNALDQLVEAELVFRHGVPPNARYSFKHALVQDAAYQSLLRGKRQHLHARIAGVLEERSPEMVDAAPELVAHHLTQAGLNEKAAAYWHRAGQHAIARSAVAEAIAHLSAGLDVLKHLPEAPVKRALELDLQLTLGGALAAGKGHGVPETGEAYARAAALSRELGRVGSLYPALDGLMTCHFSRAELSAAVRIGEEFLVLARQESDAAPQVIAHMGNGIVRLSRGELNAAAEHFQRAIALYDPVRHGGLKLTYSYAPDVICLGYLGWVLLAFGYVDQALKRSLESVMRARAISHPLSQAFALARATAVHQLRSEVAEVEEAAEAMHALAVKHGFATYVTVAEFYRGWALVQRQRVREGAERLRDSLAALRGSKDEDFFPHSLAVVAEALGRAGEIAQALDLVAEGLERTGRNEERWFAAELYRLQGQLPCSTAGRTTDIGKAEACFFRAIEIAGQQSARLWELRAATSLARLWRDQGKRAEARDLLAPTYGWFSEGFDTTDLRDAQALLKELQ